MPTEDLVRRFGAKLREIEPISRLPAAMSNLLSAITKAEYQRSDNPEEYRSASEPKTTSGK